MCRFCVQHGDGEKWYLEARNYAFDLSSDLERRDYLVGFIRDFEVSRATFVAGSELLSRAPRVVQDFARRRFTRHMQPYHFGQPVPYEDCAKVFEIATSIVRLPCVCRRFAGTADEAWCMAVTTQPVDHLLEEGFRGYADGPDVSRFERLDKEGALAMLRDAEERGLMHSVWTFVTPFIGAICNCDVASGCMAMRTTLTAGAKLMWKGEYVAGVDASACTGCRSCVGHCPFGAMEYGRADHKARVREGTCWGCGVCRAACTASAITLADRASVPAVANDW